ncbi:pilus assembly protein PilM, partial [Candidatus Sumerlaeota bacterium]|nr:pilus assembly protein PilM [Candidatus Sumerlaeota bacterium]
LKPVGIGVSPFALFNFYSFQYDTKQQVSEEGAPPAEEKKKKPGFLQLPKFKLKLKKGKEKKEPETIEKEPEEEPTFEEAPYTEVKAYVNIGLSSFDLCIGRHERVSHFGFARSVPRAGMEITESIQNRLRLKDYQEAEKIKREKTVIIAGESTEALAERGINVDASEAATAAVDRIIADIRRSLDFYVSQPDGMMVDSISLSGGESRLPELTTYLEDKLGIPVDLVTGIDSPKLRVDPGAQGADIISFPIAIGLALQGVQASRVSIDFLPPELKVVREFKSKRHLVGAMAGLLVLMIGLSSMGGNKYIQEFRERGNLYKDILFQNEARKKKADEIVKKREQLKEYFDKLAKIVTKRDYWLEFMTEIQKQKPEDIWIELLVLDPNGNVRIVGRSESERSVADFIKNLKEALKDKFEEEPKLFSYSTVYDDNLKRKVARFDVRAKCKDKKSVWQKERPKITTTTPRTLRRAIEAIRGRPIM